MKSEVDSHAMDTQNKIHKNKDGMSPCCPRCASRRICYSESALTTIYCKDCKFEFALVDVSHSFSDDGSPKKCDCGTVHYGQANTCSLCTQREAAR